MTTEPSHSASRQRLVQRQDERQDYETPPELFLSLSQEFGPFDVDVCAKPINAKLPTFYGPGSPLGSWAQDGLAAPWVGKCWMNPPYGRATPAWVKKASEAKALVVCLLPARTDTRWFHDYVLPRAKTVRFLRGRPEFWIDGKPTGQGGKFPSMVVVFDGR